MPLIFQDSAEDGWMVGVWAITEPSEWLFLRVAPDLDDSEKVMGFKLESRRQEWLASRLLINTLAGNPRKVVYDRIGNPRLSDNSFYVSITHTNGYAAVILHPDKPVGIDIEIPSDRILKVSDRFIHEDERSFITDSNRLVAQTIIWSAKEALYKWWKETDVVFKEHLRLLPFVTSSSPTLLKSWIKRGNFYKELSLKCCISTDYILVYTV